MSATCTKNQQQRFIDTDSTNSGPIILVAPSNTIISAIGFADEFRAFIYNYKANVWECSGFLTDDGRKYLRQPISVVIDIAGDYLCASYEPLGISVVEKSIEELKDYFCEVLMNNYYTYTHENDENLMKRAAEYKRWFQNNVI